MKPTFLFIIAIFFQSSLYSQEQKAPKLYSHKVVVDSIIQTKAYTYLKVSERINEKDSSQWMALPLFQPNVGDVYYYERGLQMGEFQSKELNRTFNQIMFLGGLSTSVEMIEKNIVPQPVMDTVPLDPTPPVVHTVVVKEVLQTSGYTYLRVKEGEKEEWLAVVKIFAEAGQTFTFDDAAPIDDFTSKELKRTFKEIFFISKLTLVTDTGQKESEKKPSRHAKDKNHVKVEPAQGGISISMLLENKRKYAGKIVKVKGSVTKYSANILGKNWIHIEDGTAFSGKSDLTITSEKEVKVGDVITVEGKITLDKDFGSGYFFEVIMEDAVVQNN